MSTGVLKHFSPATWLPGHNDTGIGELATCEANRSIKCVLEKQANQQSAKKHKTYTNLSDTDRAKIDQFASKVRNAAT